jgi:hypothetical protein
LHRPLFRNIGAEPHVPRDENAPRLFGVFGNGIVGGGNRLLREDEGSRKTEKAQDSKHGFLAFEVYQKPSTAILRIVFT